ncbi:DMT family transporter [Priestia megaterium]|uniref:DMT family transporter n=1 Tax=Priestia megaterium TaxID=1404 RepID=UPI00046FAF0A|nr:DMT family transporter [Priestia megaterium]PFB00404.1 EamA/RhaT family transporter [Priestia megaterium]TCN07579.1 putative membrane protein [Bacillus sp. BK006]
MIASKVKFAASLYAIMSISFWGVSFVSTKAVLDKLDPYTLLVLRFGIGALFLLVLLVLKRYPLNIPLKYIPHLIVLGILGVFVHQVIQATALLTINASAAGWIISFSPVFTVILSVFFLHEKMTLLKASGMIVAIIGVLLVTTATNQQSFQPSINVGYLLMILSTLNWAIYSVLLKRLHIQLPSLVVTFYMCLIGFTLTTPFLVRNKGWEMIPFLTSVEWAHLLFLGVFVSGVAYWYWAKALEVLEASQVSVFLYLEPLATLITAILLLQEKIIPVSILGGIIIIMGVILVNGRFLTFLSYLPWRNKNL